MLLFYLVIINGFSYALMYIDKRAAKLGRRRIPEMTFYGLGFFLGALGLVLGSQSFRHKTQKQPFKSLMHLLLVCNLGLLYFCATYL